MIFREALSYLIMSVVGADAQGSVGFNYPGIIALASVFGLGVLVGLFI